MTTEMALRSKLVEARLTAGLTQHQVASTLGWVQSQVSKLETGSTQRATFTDVVRMARLYGTALDDLAEVIR